MARPDALTLLEMEVGVLWSRSATGRLEGPVLVIASTDEVAKPIIGHTVDEAMTRRLANLVLASPLVAPSTAPAGLDECRSLVEEAYGPCTFTAGPSYLMTGDEVVVPSPAVLIRSDDSGVEDLRSANPGNWEVEEWDDLLDGTLGPWVMAVRDGVVVSICHTPTRNAEAAEAGVWTHPNHRRQGHAAAVTAEWAKLIAPERVAFYSTWDSHVASQGVASRLGLRPIGWIRSLVPTTDPEP